MQAHSDSAQIPKPLLLLIAFAQGLILLAIYRALDSHHWPWQHPLYLYPILSLAIIIPTFCLLSFTRDRIGHYLKWIGIFAVGALVVAVYTGWNLEPGDKVDSSSLAFVFCITMCIASFKALMYVQQLASGEPVTYGNLFRLSWRNFLVIALSILFTEIFWGILFLWGALFKLININFIAELIVKDWFYFPVLAVAHGFGVIIFRNLASAIDTISTLLKVLMKFLLPCLVGVALIFLCALPFTGLQTLWGTGHGSLLILWLQVLMLFFTNAVYQNESQDTPYPLAVHRFIYIGIATLPVYSLVASFGLYARINQYGLSVERCWALLIWFLLALFALGYIWGIIKKRDQWIQNLSKVNILMGLVVLACMLLVNSPILDFRKMSLYSQLQRLDAGKLTTQTFDVSYVSRNLGRAGYLALLELKEKYAKTDTSFVAKITRSLQRRNDHNDDLRKEKPTEQEFLAMLVKAPSGFEISGELTQKLYTEATKNSWEWQNLKNPYLIKCDLNKDGIAEYVYIANHDYISSAQLWYLNNDIWLSANMSSPHNLSELDMASLLKDHQPEAVAATWDDLKIGDVIFRVSR